MAKSKILLIYTGGTIGSYQDPHTGALQPFDFAHLSTQVPELDNLNIEIDVHCFEEPMDSTDIGPDQWVLLARMVESHYSSYDGFVILHGTDTMCWTAGALSFMFRNLNKPVIFTGSQLPIGMIRTDGKENLLTALEIAAAKTDENRAMVPEVGLFFQNRLFRGNRTVKTSAEYFDAFTSPNHPALAKAGVHIQYRKRQILYNNDPPPFAVHTDLDQHVALLKIFPGISEAQIRGVFDISGLRGLVLETFGSGNAPRLPELEKQLSLFIDNGGIVLNVSQCESGTVQQDLYAAGSWLKDIGVIGGKDITTPASVTKMMHLLAYNDSDEVRRKITDPICGECAL